MGVFKLEAVYSTERRRDAEISAENTLGDGGQLPYPWLGKRARRAKEKTGWKIPPNTCHTSSRPMMLKLPSERPRCWMRRARSSETNNPRTPKPSSGGTGIRLNVPNSRLSENSRLTKVAAPEATPAAAGSTTCMKPTDSGERKKPVQMPMWIKMAARTTSVKFAPGPASDIQAARRGNRSDQRGSYGALAQPIIQPPVAYVSSGKITMPKGSRRMWGMGSSETCPPWKAVRSPPNCAAHAWEASWHVVESRNTTYHTTPAIRNSVFT